MPKQDLGIETLLLLDGEIYDQGGGYWIKIEARQVEPDEHVPHGIRYALTLHDRYGTRLLGYDNAPRGEATQAQTLRRSPARLRSQASP